MSYIRIRFVLEIKYQKEQEDNQNSFFYICAREIVMFTLLFRKKVSEIWAFHMSSLAVHISMMESMQF